MHGDILRTLTVTQGKAGVARTGCASDNGSRTRDTRFGGVALFAVGCCTGLQHQCSMRLAGWFVTIGTTAQLC